MDLYCKAMSIKFDDKNNNLMEPSITNIKLRFISNTGELYDSTPEESLIYTKTNQDKSLAQYNTSIKNVLKDRTNPRKKKYCSSCKKDTMIVYIYIKNNMINTCPKCKNSWFEGDK